MGRYAADAGAATDAGTARLEVTWADVAVDVAAVTDVDVATVSGAA